VHARRAALQLQPRQAAWLHAAAGRRRACRLSPEHSAHPPRGRPDRTLALAASRDGRLRMTHLPVHVHRLRSFLRVHACPRRGGGAAWALLLLLLLLLALLVPWGRRCGCWWWCCCAAAACCCCCVLLLPLAAAAAALLLPCCVRRLPLAAAGCYSVGSGGGFAAGWFHDQLSEPQARGNHRTRRRRGHQNRVCR
jgi:hypothetical protein